MNSRQKKSVKVSLFFLTIVFSSMALSENQIRINHDEPTTVDHCKEAAQLTQMVAVFEQQVAESENSMIKIENHGTCKSLNFDLHPAHICAIEHRAAQENLTNFDTIIGNLQRVIRSKQRRCSESTWSSDQISQL